MCAISRLLDFRGTAEITRDDIQDEKKAVTRGRVAGLGRASWRLLYCQIGAFVIGTVLLSWAFAAQISN